jgi:hypothetical protein
MTEFRTTATHDGREVPMPSVNAATCDADALEQLRYDYDRVRTTLSQDAVDFRDRVAADARASAAPSEDAIRAAKFDALEDARQGVGECVYFTVGDAERVRMWLDVQKQKYAPRPVYAAPVRLSDGSTFGQVGPDEFQFTGPNGAIQSGETAWWRGAYMWRPADGALVLAVLDGAEEKR